MTALDPVFEFVEAASVPLNAWHASGGLEQANRILQENPGVASKDIFAAATIGDANAVQGFVDRDPENATKKGGPRNWDALTYLCFSRYLKLDRSKSEGFVKAATALLRAGASANTGWWEGDHVPTAEFESALYGACGIAHHPEVAKLLLDFGADPNDGETIYHTPETFDNRAMKVLVESGKLTKDSLAMMLARKADWHDFEGAKFLVENGADPNYLMRFGNTPMHHAILRDNDIRIFEVFMEHGGSPLTVARGISAYSLAARYGRGDILDLFIAKGYKPELQPFEALVAACARKDEPLVREIALANPSVIEGLREHGGSLLCNFAGTGNTEGVRLLLETGAPVWSIYKEGDGYFGVAENSTALHVAAWRIRPDVVKLLINRGANVNALDAKGQSPLMLAIKANSESYWSERKTPESVAALLAANAKMDGIKRLTGYEEVDLLLTEAGFTPSPGY